MPDQTDQEFLIPVDAIDFVEPGRRKYSVDEIDRMRAALVKRHPIREVFVCEVGGDNTSEPSEGTYRRRAERAAIVESQLRTFMENGTEPDELCPKIKAETSKTVMREACMKLCPDCDLPTWTYRLATPEDQRSSASGMAVTGTGPQYFAAHGCPGDHMPVRGTTERPGQGKEHPPRA